MSRLASILIVVLTAGFWLAVMPACQPAKPTVVVAPVGGWSAVRTAQEVSDIYFEIRENPNLRKFANWPDRWFAGHPEREQMIEAVVTLYDGRMGE